MSFAAMGSVGIHVFEQILEAMAFKNRIVGNKESGADTLLWWYSTKKLVL